MSENKDRRYWTLDEQVEHQRKLDEQRRQWEQERSAEAEQRERQAKQAELESYLRRRGQDWQDRTGSPPPRHVLERWQEEFADQKEAEYQAEREAKLKAAEQEHYNY